MKTTSKTFSFKRVLLAAALAGALPLAALAQPAPGGAGGDAMQGRSMDGGRGHHMHGGKHGEMGERGHHGGMHHRHGARFLRGIKLTDAQKDKVFAIHHALAPQMREKFKVLRQSHQELRALTTSAGYDDAKAKALTDSGARAMADIALLKARSEHDVYALLTPEQKAQVEKNKENFRQRRMSMGERGGRGPAQK